MVKMEGTRVPVIAADHTAATSAFDQLELRAPAPRDNRGRSTLTAAVIAVRSAEELDLAMLWARQDHARFPVLNCCPRLA